MTYSHYSGFPNGVSIKGVPFAMIQNANGNTFWVDSNKGSDGNKGTENQPFATLDYAIGRCTANQGDVIYVAQGHTEDIIASSGINADIAGISIIGLGTGYQRPLFTFSTSTDASFRVGARGVTLANLQFECQIASLARAIRVVAKDCTIMGCKFSDDFGALKAPASFFDINIGSDTVRGLRIINNHFVIFGTADDCVKIDEDEGDIQISNNIFDGNVTNGTIHVPVAHTINHMVIDNNLMYNNSGFSIRLLGAVSGIISRNLMWSGSYATAIDPGIAAPLENYSTSTTDKSGRLNPVVET